MAKVRRVRVRALLSAAAGASVLLTAAVAAAAERPTNPPAPREDTPEALDAWADSYLVPDDYLVLTTRPGEVIMLRAETVEPTPEGARAEVRGEFTKTERAGKVPVRSYADVWAFDCQGRRIREVRSDAYPQSNLQGRPVRLDSSKQDWQAEDGEADKALLDGVCRLAGLFKDAPDRAKVMPPPPENPLDPVQLGAWADKAIEDKGDKRIFLETGVVALYSPKIERSREGRPIVWVRTELSVLLNMDGGLTRSWRERDELDCARRRVRRLEIEGHPGQNLTGPVSKASDDVWTPLVAGEADTRIVEAICTEIDPDSLPAPPTMQTASDDEAEAWVRSFVNTNGYVVASLMDQGVVLYGVDSLALAGKDQITLEVRRELWRPDTVGQAAVRSSLWRWGVDCRDFRVRVLGGELFEKNNLKGSLGVDDTVSDWEALNADSIGGGLARKACADRVLLDGQADMSLAIAPEPLSLDARGVEQWVEESIDTGEYVLSAFDDEAALFYSTEQIERLANDHIRVWTRQEMFRPIAFNDVRVVRSMRGLVEFDCAEHRSRVLAMEAYPGSNLQGAKTVTDKPQDWTFLEPSSSLSILGTALCEAKNAVDAGEEDDPVAPTVSRKTL